MKRFVLLFVFAFLPALSLAADEKSGEPVTDYFPADYSEAPSARPEGKGIVKYAEDGDSKGNFGRQPVHDNQLFATFKADRFEHQWKEHGVELFLWDVQGWIGEDYNKLYLKSEGELLLEDSHSVEEADLELLYSRALAKFWDVQVGLRQDLRPRPQRTFAALGIQGLASYWFEVDATAYLSEDGDLSAALEAEYEVMLTQRLHVIPRLEMGLSLQDVPEYEQWQGITDLTLGARLRYQISRKLAPYVGVTWHRKIGETAHNLKKAGEDVDGLGAVAGVRFWF